MNETYWLLEIDGAESSDRQWYTSPDTWSNAPNLATKFHTLEGAEAEAKHLRIPHAARIEARHHQWVFI